MKVKFLKDYIGIYNIEYKKGSIHNIEQWHCDYRGQTPKQRTKQGIIVKCYGQGEFDVFQVGIDVELI